jgi:hypothetical protein
VSGTLRVASLLALAGLAACGDSKATPDAAKVADAAKVIDAAPPIDAAPTIDARPGAYTCLGAALPTIAPDPVPVTGKAYTIVGASLGPLEGAKVEAYRDGANPVLANTMTAADGTFTVDVPTGGVPIPAHLKFSKALYLDSYFYPATPLAGTVDPATLVVNQGGYDLLATIAQAQNPDNVGGMGIVLSDCNGDYIAGATVTVQQNGANVGTIRYTTNSLPDKAATQTDASGYVLVFNVPPGDVTIGASVGGMTLRSHAVVVAAHAITISAIVP